jgi:hypothetical protein
VDRKLDDLDARLSRTVADVADTLEARAAIMKQQQAIQRRDNGGHAAKA